MLCVIISDTQVANLIVPGGLLQGGKLYRARAYVRLGKMANQGYNDFSVTTNLPPYGGRCWITPMTG